MKTIIIPQDNEKDLKEIRESILKDIKIKIVEHMDEVLEAAIVSDVPVLQDIPIPPPTMTIGDGIGANVN